MRFSSAPTRWPVKVLIGIGLIAWLWLVTAVVAFVPFDRDTPAIWIIGTSLAIFALSVLQLVRRRWVDWHTGVYCLLTLGLLVGLYNVPLRDDLPDDALAVVERFSDEHDDRFDFARALFWDTSARFTGPTREYLLQPQRVFVLKSAAYFWETGGYVPSHLQTQLYRHQLIASGRFQPDEVKYRTGRCFNSPHGYLEIAHPTRRVWADLWAAQNFEEYEFGQVVDMPSCDGPIATPMPEGEARRSGVPYRTLLQLAARIPGDHPADAQSVGRRVDYAEFRGLRIRAGGGHALLRRADGHPDAGREAL